MARDVVLGIDLGTTNSAVAVVEAGDPAVLENHEGDRTTPSVVRFPSPDENRDSPFVGDPALNKAMMDPGRTIQSIKRHMGEDYTVTVDGIEYTPEQISHHILRKLRRDAAKKLDVEPTRLPSVVVTVPAYFTEDARQATRDAARIAGFNDITIINEPTAAAMAYGYREDDTRRTVLVYDLGGGTFDVSVMDIGDGAFRVQATNGDRNLGGDDFDQALMEHVAERFKERHGVNPLERQPGENEGDYLQRRRRIRTAVKNAKERLSNQGGGEVQVSEMFLMEHDGERLNLDQRVDAATFNQVTQHLLDRTTDPTLDAVKQAGYNVHEIDDVLLVGGATRMPQVETKVRELFNADPKHSVNRDEAVAVGAAIHGNQNEVLLQDVTPLTLGIKLKGDVFKPIVERNSTLPAEGSQIFTTSQDRQTSVEIDVYQGEREIASENRHLKTFYLTDIPPAPKGVPQIEVTFRVDKDGLVTARAVDRSDASGGRAEEVQIKGANNLTDEEVQGYIEEARKKEERDRERRKVIEARNEAQEAVDRGKRFVSNYGGQLDSGLQADIESEVEATQQRLDEKGTTLGDLQDQTERLKDLLAQVGEQVHAGDLTDSTGRNAGSGGGGAVGGSPGAGGTAGGEPDTDAGSATHADPGGGSSAGASGMNGPSEAGSSGPATGSAGAGDTGSTEATGGDGGARSSDGGAIDFDTGGDGPPGNGASGSGPGAAGGSGGTGSGGTGSGAAGSGSVGDAPTDEPVTTGGSADEPAGDADEEGDFDDHIATTPTNVDVTETADIDPNGGSKGGYERPGVTPGDQADEDDEDDGGVPGWTTSADDGTGNDTDDGRDAGNAPEPGTSDDVYGAAGDTARTRIDDASTDPAGESSAGHGGTAAEGTDESSGDGWDDDDGSAEVEFGGFGGDETESNDGSGDNDSNGGDSSNGGGSGDTDFGFGETDDADSGDEESDDGDEDWRDQFKL